MVDEHMSGLETANYAIIGLDGKRTVRLALEYVCTYRSFNERKKAYAEILYENFGAHVAILTLLRQSERQLEGQPYDREDVRERISDLIELLKQKQGKETTPGA